MAQIKIYGVLNESILKEILIDGGDRKYNQINIYCTMFEFNEYIRQNMVFDYELNGYIKNSDSDEEYPLLLSSLIYKEKRFNFIASDYYSKNSNMIADYINDENYSAIEQYITKNVKNKN